MTEMRIGAWIGEIPNYLLLSEDDSSRGEDSTDSASLEKIDADIKLPAQDIASYQVINIGNLSLFLCGLLLACLLCDSKKAKKRAVCR